ncbi:MAG TPA: 16S rRNA (uracil(1498)-N(3))-methyltransferase [Stellaceae bacterium]|jgi:16S rRNA (uracil1498-N3)-methyltransferase
MKQNGIAERRPPRLHIIAGLAPGVEVEPAPGQAHYLRTVLRLGASSPVAVFNAAHGEWLCRVAEVGKSAMRLTVERQLRQPEPEGEPDLWLLFAPIKRTPLDWLVEKAAELGVAALLPVWTARTQVERINVERLRAHAVEAAEQSERLSVPELRAPQRLDQLLAEWPSARRLIVCDETGAGEPISDAAARLSPGPVALLVGPEGGFDETELDALDKLSFVTRVGLGPRVLRAETAALAAVAVLQAIAGDWRRVRTR